MARKTRNRQLSAEPIEDEILTEPADTIDPYTTLGIEKSATQDEVKSAYRKAALKHHPDKAKPEEKDEAKVSFQGIATAYAILSDEKRRRRYDTTGNTSESLDDDDFNWTDFFREQSAAVINGELIEQIKKEYQGSEEEREDVLRVYEEGEGDLDLIYETVICSDVISDDQRFRKYIDDAIASGTVERYQKYARESKEKEQKRIRKAKGEEQEAIELAEQLGLKEKLFGKSEKTGRVSNRTNNDEDSLKALIQQRQKDRSENFFDHLEAKYGGGKKSKRKDTDEPPEELFQKNAKRPKSRR